MAINKVIIDGTTVLDLTETTVTPGAMASGVTAVDHTGTSITGTSVAQASGSIHNYSGDIYYSVRDDVVSVWCDGVASYTSFTIPAEAAPGHKVMVPCVVTDSNDNVYSNGAQITIQANGNASISGMSGVASFCFAYIRGVS